MALVRPKEYHHKVLPFIDFLLEDKSKYKLASTAINIYTNQPYIDPNNYFRIGESGGFLMNMEFVFVHTERMRTTAKHFEDTGAYCPYEADTFDAAKWWKREKNRRVKGIYAKCRLDIKDIPEYYDPTTTEQRRAKLVKDVYVTGNHYSYLNYGRMDRVPTPDEKVQLVRDGYVNKNTIQGFPSFRDCDWWYFICDQFARDNGLNLCIGKARRKGYSYKVGDSNGNELNLYKDITICNAAYKVEYLTNEGAIAHMTRESVNWFERHTIWKRGFDLKKPLEEFILGYQDEGQSAMPNEWSACKNRQTQMNTSVFIGSKAYRLNNEECGKFNNLYDYLGVTMSLMDSGLVKVGMMTSWGTAGTEDANWGDFAHMFRNCTYKSMKFENVWDINRRGQTCGFFHPNVWGLEPHIDRDGNSLYWSAYAFDRIDKNLNADSLNEDEKITYYAQRANTPDEAFINTTVNIFASEVLNNHILNLKTNPDLQFYQDGMYVYDGGEVALYNKHDFQEKGLKWHDYIMDVPHRKSTDVLGCVREFYPPQRIDGKVPENMYFIVVDPTGVDKNEQKDITESHSLYSFQVFTYYHTDCPLPPKTLVSEYTGRLPRREDNDLITLYAALRYNAKVLPEVNRGETVTNFKKWKYRSRLMKDPTKYFTRREDNLNTDDFGITITTERKFDGLKQLKDELYEIIGRDENDMPIYRLQSIMSISLLLELQSFSVTGNFDRISAYIIATYEFVKETLRKKEDILNPRTRNKKSSKPYKGLGDILARR
jgi:hypothetical protein